MSLAAAWGVRGVAPLLESFNMKQMQQQADGTFFRAGTATQVAPTFSEIV